MILYCIYIDILISQYILYTLNTATIYWYNKVLKLMLYFFSLKLDIFLSFQYHRQTGNDASWLFLKKGKQKQQQHQNKINRRSFDIFKLFLFIIWLLLNYLAGTKTMMPNLARKILAWRFSVGKFALSFGLILWITVAL